MSLLLVAALMFCIAQSAPANAQMPMTPGPGGVPIAPGAPVTGYTPGGIGPGGAKVAPGPAARDVPMYRVGPGGVRMPPGPDPRPDGNNATVGLDPACKGSSCTSRVAPQSLQLTISSRDAGRGKVASSEEAIDSIDGLFAALRACWEPPAREQAVAGLQMSVRFSFRRTGQIVAPPFVTYTTPGTRIATKRIYQSAITAALDRCAPLQFSRTFSGAIAGRPISVRYVDDRIANAEPLHP